MKTKFWSVAVALLALVLCGTAMLTYAQEATDAPAAGWHGHGQHHMAWMAKELNLTDAQKAADQDHDAVRPRHHASADAATGGEPHGHAGGDRQRRL